MKDYTVSVFYKINGLPDMVFHEDVSIQMGSQVNAETKENADVNFKSRVENECNFFRRADGLPEIEVEIIDKRVYQDSFTAFRTDEVLTKKAKYEFEQSQIEFEKQMKFQAEENRRLKLRKEEWNKFLDDLDNQKLKKYLNRYCSGRDDLTRLYAEQLYSDGFGYFEIEKFKDKLSDFERKSIFEKYPLSDIRKAWIESEVDNIDLKPKSQKDLDTVTFIHILSESNNYYGFQNNLKYLPRFISGFKFYTREMLYNLCGVGEKGVFLLAEALNNLGFNLKITPNDYEILELI